ncbi:MAG: hypothetical protein Kow0090_09230 [Myxococcota bacterium]
MAFVSPLYAEEGFSGSARIGGSYNSNIPLLSTLEKESGLAVIEGEQDPGGVVAHSGLTFSYSFLDSDDLFLSSSYLISLDAPPNFLAYSYLYQSFIFDVGYTVDYIMLSLLIIPRFVMTDISSPAPYYWDVAGYFDFFALESDNWATGVTLGVDRYDSLNSDVQYLQGIVLSGELAQYWYPTGGKSYISLSAFGDRAWFPSFENVADSLLKVNYGNAGGGAKIAAKIYLKPSLYLYASARIKRWIYDEEDKWLAADEASGEIENIFVKKRGDMSQHYSISLDYKFTESWEVELFGGFIKNGSNLGEDELDYIDRRYEQIISGTAIEYFF